MQNVQVLLQPTEIETHAAYAESRRVGRVEGKRLERLEDLDLGALVVARPVQQGREAADVVGAEDDVDPRRPLDDGGAVLLGHAPADGDLHVGVVRLGRAQLAEVAVELVVGVLAHGTGVEDDDVGRLGALVHGHAGEVDVARCLEQAGEALGVVDVHLAAVRAHVVGLQLSHGLPRVRAPCGATRPRQVSGRRGGRSSHVDAPQGGDVPDVGAAAATDDVETGQAGCELRVALHEIGEVTLVELRRVVELGVGLPRGVDAQAGDLRGPAVVGLERRGDVARVRAVDEETVRRCLLPQAPRRPPPAAFRRAAARRSRP